eukprot:514474-Rhodomonas_salina.1
MQEIVVSLAPDFRPSAQPAVEQSPIVSNQGQACAVRGRGLGRLGAVTDAGASNSSSSKVTSLSSWCVKSWRCQELVKLRSCEYFCTDPNGALFGLFSQLSVCFDRRPTRECVPDDARVEGGETDSVCHACRGPADLKRDAKASDLPDANRDSLELTPARPDSFAD